MKITKYEKKLVIIPAYNEEKSIGKVIDSIRRAIRDVDIIVIDDNSSDRTREVALSKEANVISHVINCGYGAALQTGYKYAVLSGYDAIAQLDGDGQHDPSFLTDLFNKMQIDGYDVVIGSRFIAGSHRKEYNMSLPRKIGRDLFKYIIFLITKKKISDPTSGYQALNKKVFSLLAKGNIFPSDYPDADVIVTLIYSGFNLTEIPVLMYENMTGRTIHSGMKPLYYIIKMLISLFIVKVNSGKSR